MMRKRRTILAALLVLGLPVGGFLLQADAPTSSNQPRSPADAAAKVRPLVVVEAFYAGAGAQVVSDDVAVPVEKELNRLEKVRRLASRCTSDGRYTLLIEFEPGVDPDMAQFQIQQRLQFAVPLLPTAVQDRGVSVRKQAAGVSLFVLVTSPDGRFDARYLRAFAALRMRDDLYRLPGSGDVMLFGDENVGPRIVLDAEKLAARSLTAADVRKALREQDVQVPLLGRQGAQMILERPADLDKVADTVVRATPRGVVRLRDVGRLEMGGEVSCDVSLDGKAGAALGIFALPQTKPRDLRAALDQWMKEFKEELPAGVDAFVLDLASRADAKDRAASACLVSEPTLPAGTSAKRTQEVLDRYAHILAATRGVEHVLVLPENPFDRFRAGACVVASLDPKLKDADRKTLVSSVRRQLNKVAEAEPRLRELTGEDIVGRNYYQVDLAIRGPEAEAVQEFGEKLAERLGASRRLADLWAGPDSVRQWSLDIDRAKTNALGVAVADILSVLQIYAGPDRVGEAGDFGRTVKIVLRLENVTPDHIKELAQLTVRSSEGKIVRLGTVSMLRESTAWSRLDRLDNQPAVFLAAMPAPNVSLAEARWLCETAAEDVRKELRLPAAYKLIWLKDMPEAKALAAEPKGADETPPEVAVRQPLVREVTDFEDYTGRLDAANAVSLRPRVTGYVEKVNFQEGAKVKKGDVLFEIDPRPYEVEADQARSQVKLCEATLKLARVTLDRDQAIAKATPGAVTQQQLDVDKAASEEAEARLEVAKFKLKGLELNVEFTRVRSPIDGKIGRALVTRGNLADADRTVLAEVIDVKPMYVYFDMDGRTFLKLKIQDDSELPIAVGLDGEEGYPRKGKINLVDNRVNADTGTIAARAVLDGGDGSLRPGMFARVRVPVGAPHKALLIPDEAIRSDQGRKVVYLVDDQNKVVVRPVSVGQLHDGMRVIEKGLQPGDRVINTGKRVRPGMTVKPVPADAKSNP